MRRGLAVLLLAASMVSAGEPVIDHQPVRCILPDANARICAQLADDGAISKARVYFRAAGRDDYYFVAMSFTGIEHCATLPAPAKGTTAVDYYVWALDDEAGSARSRNHRFTIDRSGVCEFPVIDDDPSRCTGIVVHTSTPKQKTKLKGFDRKQVASVKPPSSQ